MDDDDVDDVDEADSGPRTTTDMRLRSELNSNTATTSCTSSRPRKQMVTRSPCRARSTTPIRLAPSTSAASSGLPAWKINRASESDRSVDEQQADDEDEDDEAASVNVVDEDDDKAAAAATV